MAIIRRSGLSAAMQIRRAYLQGSSSRTFVERRYDFLTRVIVGISVQDGEACEVSARTAAMAEVDRLLQEVGELLEQRFG